MMELSQTALFIGSIINLYALVLILRAWLQFARVDYYNPVSTFAVKMTDPVLKPLRKIAPTVKNIDTSALLLIFIIGILKGIFYFGLSVNFLLILSVLTISNVGFSEIQEAYGMIFDERVFGDNKACKASGAYILGSASFQVLALAVANDNDFNSKEKLKYM